MISNSTRRGLALASVLALLSYWATRGGDDEADEGIEGLDTRLDYALQNFDMRAFDEDGKPALRLWSPKLTNEAATNVGRVDSPRLEVQHEGFLWQIVADSAIISSNQDQVFLTGSVHIERNGATPADRIDIDSRDVTLEVDDRVAHSVESVQIADLSGTLRARGFRVNMLTEEFQLHNDVEGVYVTPQ
jgi:LPS export ABC transporter protein LptC